MLSTADTIKADIERTKAEIAKADKDIAEREERLDSIRDYRWRKANWLLTLQGQLERENAPVRKPLGSCVEEVAPNGEVWKV